MPPGGISAAPYGTSYGRPVAEIEQASALSDVGDIAFIDLSHYALVRRCAAGRVDPRPVPLQPRTFRWVVRVNGAPKLKSATRSPFAPQAAPA